MIESCTGVKRVILDGRATTIASLLQITSRGCPSFEGPQSTRKYCEVVELVYFMRK